VSPPALEAVYIKIELFRNEENRERSDRLEPPGGRRVDREEGGVAGAPPSSLSIDTLPTVGVSIDKLD
jgi:hypothetical protein